MPNYMFWPKKVTFTRAEYYFFIVFLSLTNGLLCSFITLLWALPLSHSTRVQSVGTIFVLIPYLVFGFLMYHLPYIRKKEQRLLAESLDSPRIVLE